MRKLALIIAAAMMPAAVLAMVLVGYDYYERERTRLIRDSLSTTRAMVAAVDGELLAVKAALRALATSTLLTTNDFESFHTQALDAVQAQGSFVNVILSDAKGRQLLNMFRPFGTPLPATGDPGGLLRVFETGAPVVSDLFKGPGPKATAPPRPSSTPSSPPSRMCRSARRSPSPARSTSTGTCRRSAG